MCKLIGKPFVAYSNEKHICNGFEKALMAKTFFKKCGFGLKNGLSTVSFQVGTIIHSLSWTFPLAS